MKLKGIPLPPHTVINYRQAEKLIFDILCEPSPDDGQRRSAKRLIKKSVNHQYFHSLIFDLAKLKGCYDNYCDKFYILIDEPLLEEED